MHIFIDCTHTYLYGLNTGIQRVVRKIAEHAPSLENELGVQCTLVYLDQGNYRTIPDLNQFSWLRLKTRLRQNLNKNYIRLTGAIRKHQGLPNWLNRFLSAPRTEFGLAQILFSPFAAWARLRNSKPPTAPDAAEDHFQLGTPGDILFFPDSNWSTHNLRSLQDAKKHGLRLVFFMHDILPMTHPEFFQPTHAHGFSKWFCDIVEIADCIICNSKTTQRATIQHIQKLAGKLPSSEVRHAYLGHDFSTQGSSRIQHQPLLNAFTCSVPCYLCVGTIEPRKDYETVLNAMNHYWAQGGGGRLILIGRYGWLSEQTVTRITQHPEFNKRLFWFENVGDDDLSACYRKASAQIIASIAEGFGLPVIEALTSGTPVIASDIAVFREIASEQAIFFQAQNALSLAAAMSRFEALQGAGAAIPSENFFWPSWRDATRDILFQASTIDSRDSFKLPEQKNNDQ